MTKRLLPFVAAAALVAACSPDSAAPTGASPSTAPISMAVSATGAQIITDAEVARQAENTAPTAEWVLYTRNGGSGTFATGPGTVPEGVGSLGFSTPTSADKVFLFHYGEVGTPLSELTALQYATYRTSGEVAVQDPALNVEVDVNGSADGGFTTLVFEPVYNTTQGSVADGEWQTWDAINGGAGHWWSTHDIPGVCAFDCFVEWSSIVAANPDAVVVGGVGLNQGSGNPALVAAVDQFVIGTTTGTTTYDFDPFVAATTRETCQHDGWQQVRRADGSTFKNQGDCVSYTENGK